MKDLIKKPAVIIGGAAIFVSAWIAVVASGVGISDIFRSLKGMNPRLMGISLLPFLILAIVLGNYLRKRKEERMWKDALEKTRAKRKEEAARRASRNAEQS